MLADCKLGSFVLTRGKPDLYRASQKLVQGWEILNYL